MQKPMLGEMIDWSDPINQGLVLLLRLNEGMGDHVSDLSLNDNHGTLKNFTHPGTPSSGWTPGFRGKTIAFDGGNDYIDCGNNPSLDITEAITISAWIKPRVHDSRGWIVSKSDYSSVGGYGIYLQGSIDVLRSYAGNSKAAVSDAAYTEFGEWILVTTVLSPSGNSFYKNGELINTDNSITSSDLNINSFDVTVGARTDLAAGNFFDGDIDEVRIYNRALLPSEIFKLALEGSPAITPKGRAYPNYFVFDCATTGAAETFALPLEATGTYDFEVHWGDGTWDIITAHDDAAATHTYASAGTHQIVIDGHIEGFRFNNAGDKLKIRDIKSWGCLQLGNNNGYFYGCTGLTVSATDILNLNGTTTLYRLFRGCTSLTTVPNINSWDISNIVSLHSVFYDCTSLVFIEVSSWNTSSVDTLGATFGNCSVLTDPAINNWDITSVTTASGFMNGAKALSTAVYDATLIAWEGQVEQPNVTAHFGTSKYSAGAAATARAALVANGWTITDGGAA